MAVARGAALRKPLETSTMNSAARQGGREVAQLPAPGPRGSIALPGEDKVHRSPQGLDASRQRPWQ